MNSVVSYTDLMDFMRWSPNNFDQLLPVVLIKPSTILYLNREHRLDHIFSYFDRRSGEGIQFFLPGYAHYPSLRFADILPNVRPYNENAVALSLNRQKEIYYSDNDFINFVEIIENNNLSFKYYGNSELLFIKYIAGSNGSLGRFDFTVIHRFNLSRMYYSHHENFYQIEHFLEEVLHTINNAQSDDELIESINSFFDE